MSYHHHHRGGATGGGFHQNANQGYFDGKRMRKAIHRKTVDFNSVMIRYMEARKLYHINSQLKVQPDPNFVIDLHPSFAYKSPMSSVTTRFSHSSTNKLRCPINAVKWTPDGRRVVTGAYTGEFTLWNGLSFNFETIMQAHDKAVRTLTWSHNDIWLVSADDEGIIKYWQSSMNNLKAFQGHKDVIRGLSFAPSDNKFASCSDDGTIKIWNFADGSEERVLAGHGWDVKCIDWHPRKGLLASGSKDNLVKLWDPKTGKNLTTLHGHKNTIMSVQWNQNGNWLLTASRDQLVRLYDIRTMKEIQSFKGHKREVVSLAWHPHHESMFASGGWDGAIHFWQVGNDQNVGGMEAAHESAVWSMDWHPLGHILVSGSNDYTTRFWTRNRPGDGMRERFDLTRSEQEALGVANQDVNDDEEGGPIGAGGNAVHTSTGPWMRGTTHNLPGLQKSSLPGLSEVSLPGLSSSSSPPNSFRPGTTSEHPSYKKQKTDDYHPSSHFSHHPNMMGNGPVNYTSHAPHPHPPPGTATGDNILLQQLISKGGRAPFPKNNFSNMGHRGGGPGGFPPMNGTN